MEASSALYELASRFLACRYQDTLLKAFAARVGAALGARAVFVWTNPGSRNGDGDAGKLICKMRWSAVGERFTLSGDLGEGILTETYETPETRRFSAAQIEPEAFEHLDEATRSRIKSALFASLPGDQGSAGVVEVLNKRSGEFNVDDTHFLEEACRLAGHALTNPKAIEGERQIQLSTLERLTALYDLGRTFTSTLELSELLPIVAVKIRDLLGGSVCNLWLTDGGSGELYLAKQVGSDPTVEEGARVPLAEGLLGGIAQQASAKLVEEPASEAGLEERIQAGGDFEIQSWMGAPLRKDDTVLGVVELVNRTDGGAFPKDDLFIFPTVRKRG